MYYHRSPKLVAQGRSHNFVYLLFFGHVLFVLNKLGVVVSLLCWRCKFWNKLMSPFLSLPRYLWKGFTSKCNFMNGWNFFYIVVTWTERIFLKVSKNLKCHQRMNFEKKRNDILVSCLQEVMKDQMRKGRYFVQLLELKLENRFCL